MNIIEAIKSGKRFRRRSYPIGHWYKYGNLNVVAMVRSDAQHYYPDKLDILASDWEVEEESITITKADLEYALIHGGVISIIMTATNAERKLDIDVDLLWTRLKKPNDA